MYAIYDPLSVPNNRVGVHVLSPDELESATKLVNNDGEGEWGYITVPIQAGDRDKTKWTLCGFAMIFVPTILLAIPTIIIPIMEHISKGG